MSYKFDIVLPWDKDRLREDSRLRWPISFLRDRQMPFFIYDKPSEKTIERVCFLTEQLCARKRRWVVCFSDCTTYMNNLLYYVTASFVLTSGLSAEITTPKKLVEYAFDFGNSSQFGGKLHPFQVCGMLTIPYFDPMYPGYQKARPKITELLMDRKVDKKPCIVEVFVSGKLPETFEGLAKYTPFLRDLAGDGAKDLFGGNTAKFLVVKKERI